MTRSSSSARGRKVSLAIALAVAALAVAALLAPPPAAGAAAPKLDHFLVYQVERVAAKHKVELSDQFNLPLAPAVLEFQTHFANPTRKKHPGGSAGIVDTDHHLSWYTAPAPQPRRTVRFRNQFGQHSVDTGPSAFLLVPTQKTSDRGSEFPKDLDHYRCYRVVKVNGAPAMPVVQLGDQFGRVGGLQVGQPILFCNPSRKVREGEPPIGVQNATDHLAVYELPPRAVARRIKVRDQFGDRALRVTRRVLLAVPTEKQVFVTHP